MSKNPNELQPAHQRFADEYLLDFNATEAYKRAGYKAKGNAAFACASRLLARPEVQLYLAKRREELTASVALDQEEVLRRLGFMALGDIRQLFDASGNLKGLQELTAEQASLIQGVEVFEEYEGRGDERTYVGQTKKIRFVNRLDAVKTLGQHFGMFSKKVEHSGPGGTPIAHKHEAVGELLDLIEGADTGPGPATSRR